ncbi:MAG TPA: hypothetical protein VIJ39_09230 [Solirubrobacteraceae bacterium]
MAPISIPERFAEEASAGFDHARRALLSPFVRIQERPVIVLGNHKAGTSAIAGLLGALTGESVALELRKELKRDRYRAVHEGRTSFATLVARNKVDFSRAIIKENHFSTMPEQVIAYFPSSPVIMITREPRDNIRSLLNRLRIPGDRDRIAADTRQSVPDVWKLTLDGHWLGLTYDTYIEQLALRWNLIVDHYLANRERWVLQRYEDFQADKLGQLTALAQDVGLAPTRDISDELEYPFQPRGNRSATWEAFYGEQNLATIERICGSRMAQLGYRLDRAPGTTVEPLSPPTTSSGVDGPRERR